MSRRAFTRCRPAVSSRGFISFDCALADYVAGGDPEGWGGRRRHGDRLRHPAGRRARWCSPSWPAHPASSWTVTMVAGPCESGRPDGRGRRETL